MARARIALVGACLAALGGTVAAADGPQPLPGSRTVRLGDGIGIVVPPATIPCADGRRGPVVWGATFAASAAPKWKLQTAIWGDRSGAKGPFHIEHQFFARDGRTQYTSWPGPHCGATYQLTARPGVAPGGPPLRKKVKARTFRFTVAPAPGH